MPENHGPRPRRDVGRYVNDALARPLLRRLRRGLRAGRTRRSRRRTWRPASAPPTSTGTAPRTRPPSPAPPSSWSTARAAARRMWYPNTPALSADAPRLRPRHPRRPGPQRPARTHPSARARRPVAGRDARRPRPRPRPPRRLLLRRLARPQPGPPPARPPRLGHRCSTPAAWRRWGCASSSGSSSASSRPSRPRRCARGWPPGWNSRSSSCRSCARWIQDGRPRLPHPPPRPLPLTEAELRHHPDPALPGPRQAQPAGAPAAAAGTRPASDPRRPRRDHRRHRPRTADRPRGAGQQPDAELHGLRQLRWVLGPVDVPQRGGTAGRSALAVPPRPTGVRRHLTEQLTGATWRSELRLLLNERSGPAPTSAHPPVSPPRQPLHRR